MPKVLISDCWTRKSLSAVRSLGLTGVEVYAISHKRLSPALYSGFMRDYFIVADPEKEPEKYIKQVLEILQKNSFDCLMPFEEASIKAFLNSIKEIEKYTRLPLATKEQFNQAADKWEVLKLALELGVPAPKTFRPQTDSEVEKAIAELGFPFIIKPTNSSGSRGLKKINNQEEFNSDYPAIKLKYGRPLMQEYIEQSGQGVGVGLLADKGKVLVDFSYKRLREFPVNGGPSTLRESTDDSNLKAESAKLIKALNWTGVAMVEFKTDPQNGIPKLMEINPRFWGSMDLAAVSGVNFPFLLYQFSQGKKIEQPAYKIGIKDRWLIPGDIAHFIANPKRFSLIPSFFKFFEKNTFYDDFNRKDLKGNIAVIICGLLSVFDWDNWKLGVFRK